MTQEVKKSGKKWIWLVAGLVLLLAIVGVVLALVLGGGSSAAEIPMEGRADLYWNVDRLTYLKLSTTGQTSRQPAEDGLYHIRFAYQGEQIELTTADRSLVNKIDTMDIMGLELAKDGTTIEGAIAASKVAKVIGEPVYVQRTADNMIIVNASAALNSVSTELTITENTRIYDVNPKAEKIGAVCALEEIGSADALYVYANGSDEVTHVYLYSHPVRSPLYWATERKYSSSTKSTTREPDANGEYIVPAYSDGEYVELKFKDANLVTQIDKKNKYSLHFGVSMDQNGYVIQLLTADEALGATSPADRWFVTEVNGANVKLQKFGTSPKEYTFNLPEDCPIYDMSLAAKVEGRQGQRIDHLEWGDRVTMWVDGNGKPIMIYVSNALVENVPCYFNAERKYSTKTQSTTREPNSDGYYEVKLYKDGDSGFTDYLVKDKELIDRLDSMSFRMFGLIVDNENVIQQVYYAESLFGYTQFTTGRTVEAIIGPFVTCIINGKPMDTVNAAMSTACEVYNVSGYGDFGRTLLQVGDHITANRGFDGYNDTDIMHVYVVSRHIGKEHLAFNLDRQYDSETKQSTRKPDEDGWYRIPIALNGEERVVRTRSKAMVDKMESFSIGVTLELSGDVVVGAYDPAWATGGKKVTSGYRIVSFGEFNTLKANLKTVTTEIKLAEDCVYYNVSDAYYDHKGEETSYLAMGDMISAFTNRHGEVEVVFVRGRETKGMYWNTKQMYNNSTKKTLREPDAEGWYNFELMCDGELKHLKTKDLELASKVDSYGTGFGLVLQGDVIRSVVSSSWVDDVSSTAASNWDVVGVDGNTLTVKYNLPGSTKSGTTTTLRMNSATKVYDVSPTAENFGAPANIKVGDRIRAYGSETYTDTLSYVYIMTHDTRAAGQEAYCEHCQQVVFWNPWRGEGFSKGDAHYYLNADIEAYNQLSVYNENLQYEVVLDLNGHTYHTEGKRGFAVYRGETFTIMDSVGGGCLSATGATGGYGGVFTLVSQGTLNLYGGTIKGVEREDQTVVYGGTIYATGNINIYGGEIVGGVTKADLTLDKKTAYGGAIMSSGATINMYGGKISGGKAADYVYEVLDENGNPVIDEDTGLVQTKTSDGRGGNVYITGGVFNMYGGEIVDGNASHGGNIYVSNCTFNMEGGTISGGVATNGGNAYIYTKGKLITSGDALITGGTATRSASRNNGGGNIFMFTKSSVLMEGGSITNGTAVSYGGNIAGRGGELIVKDGIISGGKSETAGDNVFINGAKDAGTMLVLAGGQVADGSVYVQKPAEEGRINIGLTGAPVVDLLDLADGAIFEMYELTEGASITVAGAGTLSAPYEKAGEYAEAGYFKAVNAETSVIKAAEDNTLYVSEKQAEMYCEHCDKVVLWTPWRGNSLNTEETAAEGHYILTQDFKSSSQIRIGTDTKPVSACIDLNGHNIANTSRAFAVYGGSTLTLMNSSETESRVTGGYTADVGGVINLSGASNLNLYDNVALASTAANFSKRGGIVNMGDGTFNMHGGILEGQTSLSGGALYINKGILNMTGGVITGGSATASGGNIYLNGGVINLTGGIIENGWADGSESSSNGGNIYMAAGELNISGDAVVTSGVATRSAARTNGGGNIYGQDKTVINISGGTISGGETLSFGGNVYCRGNLTISGGLITGGTAANGGNVFVSGYSYEDASLNITGGIIENGNITTGELDNLKLMVKEAYDGSNIYVTCASATISGGQIADNDGGNAILAITAKESIPASVNLIVKDNAELIAALDGKVYLIAGAELTADLGGAKADADGDKIWVVEGYDVEVPTTPDTVPTEPSEPSQPTEPEAVKCPECGYEGEWTNWDGSFLNTADLNGKHVHYVLNKDIITSNQIRIGADATDTAEAVVVNACIDLNGYKIENKARAFAVYAGSTLTLLNTSDTESVVTGAYSRDIGGVINLSGASNLNLHDGVKLQGVAETFGRRGGVVNMGTGTFNMHGGTMVGQVSTNGGVLYIGGGTFNMTGGLITGGTATASGGNIYLGGGVANISGGIIENGLADGSASSSNGGNIYMAKGELNISGEAIIRGGNATRAVARTNGGGNIYGQDKTVINISGGRIENGTAASFGGNVYCRGTLTISGGVITGGTAANGGNLCINGHDYADAALIITGGIIENGNITTGELCNPKLMVKEAYDGSNIYNTCATVTISGGQITDNDGGNAILAIKAKESKMAAVNLQVAENEELAKLLDGKIYLTAGAVLNADLGATVKDSDGDEVWYLGETPVEPTEPSVEPTEPSVPGTEPTVPEETTAPTEPEATQPSTAPTEPEATEPSTAPTEPSEPVNACPHCGEAYEKISFTAWTAGSGSVVTESGHYYLAADAETLTSQIKIGSADVAADVFIDLRGNSFTGKNVRIFSISAGSTLTVVDTVGGGELVGAGNGGNVINIAANATFNLYDATLTNTRVGSTSMGGVVNTTDGTAETPSVFNMYSGTLNGGDHAGNGGAVCIRKFAQFNMYGGTVNGASCSTEGKSPSGAAVATRAASSVVRIYGGTINAGSSAGLGDCVYVVNGATFVVEGGQFLGGDVHIKTVGENAIVLSGEVVFEDLDLSAGGIITLGEGGITGGIVKLTVAEGVLCGASEYASTSVQYLDSLNPNLQFAVDADNQIVIQPATRQIIHKVIKPAAQRNLKNRRLAV